MEMVLSADQHRCQVVVRYFLPSVRIKFDLGCCETQGVGQPRHIARVGVRAVHGGLVKKDDLTDFRGHFEVEGAGFIHLVGG